MNQHTPKIIMSAALFAASLGTLFISSPCWAQAVDEKAIENSGYFSAPRQIQIIDDRPYVRDFREQQVTSGTIDLPLGPQGGGQRKASYGGCGAGALHGGPGSTIPAGGLHMSSNDGYRTADTGKVPLSKSGFGRDTNIPARGIAPRASLPDGSCTNRLMSQPAAAPSAHVLRSTVPARPIAIASKHGADTPGGNAATYGSDYRSGYGSSAFSSRSESLVHGSLLRKNN